MNRLKTIVLLFACLTLVIYACKKETLTDHDFVQKHFIGKWPLKSRVSIKFKNKDTMSKDTLRFSPIDTLVFTADGKYTKGLISADYTIDEKGENLTIATTPAVIWHIEYLRQNSIILTQRRTETIGADIFTYYTEENLVK